MFDWCSFFITAWRCQEGAVCPPHYRDSFGRGGAGFVVVSTLLSRMVKD